MTDELRTPQHCPCILRPVLSREEQRALEETLAASSPPPAVAPQPADLVADLAAAIKTINAVPLALKAPIKLTRAQINVLVDVYPPDVDHMPVWLVGVERITGVPVVEVAIVEDSTPYLEGWLS